MRKKLLFLWSLLSLAGFIIGLAGADGHMAFYIDELFYAWGVFSIPLIIHLILRFSVTNNQNLIST